MQLRGTPPASALLCPHLWFFRVPGNYCRMFYHQYSRFKKLKNPTSLKSKMWRERVAADFFLAIMSFKLFYRNFVHFFTVGQLMSFHQDNSFFAKFTSSHP